MEDDTSLSFEDRVASLQTTMTWCARRLARGTGPGQSASAEDVVHDAVARLLDLNRREQADRPTHRAPLSELPDAELRRYAVRTVTNRWFDICRKHRARPDTDAVTRSVATAPPEAVLARLVALDRSLERDLDDRERQFLRRSVELGSAARAQEDCGWPPGSPSNAAHRLKQIRERLRGALA